MGPDDLYHILFTHWVFDDATYRDERQRVQVSTGILLASYTGCRPCSLFDTSPGSASDDHAAAVPYAHSTGIRLRGHRPGSDDTDAWSSENDCEDDNETSADSSDHDDSGDDDGICVNLGETASICYKDVNMFLVRNSISGAPNVLAAKITLLHTKGAERKSQSSS